MTVRNITIAGAGNVGSALARNLVRHGLDVQLAASDLASAQSAARAVGDRVRAVELAALPGKIDALCGPRVRRGRTDRAAAPHARDAARCIGDASAMRGPLD